MEFFLILWGKFLKKLKITSRNNKFQRDFLILRHNIRSMYYGAETAFLICLKNLDTWPNDYKDATLLKSYKENLKKWILKTVHADYAKLIFKVYCSQPRVPCSKPLHGWLCISSFRGGSNEYKELLGTWCLKAFVCSLWLFCELLF